MPVNFVTGSLRKKGPIFPEEPEWTILDLKPNKNVIKKTFMFSNPSVWDIFSSVPMLL